MSSRFVGGNEISAEATTAPVLIHDAGRGERSLLYFLNMYSVKGFNNILMQCEEWKSIKLQILVRQVESKESAKPKN